MNIEECYEKMGGNYAAVSMRLPSQGLIKKFIGRFLEDQSFDTLCRQMECGNREEAFRAAHTLKGVCANLSFSRLQDSVSLLTEELRPETSSISERAIELLKDVRCDYAITVEAIREYLEQSQE